MLSNRPTGSEPERRLRSELRKLSIPYRAHRALATATGRVVVDFVFPDAKLAVFVDGCFWHACPRHATWPKQHAAWWKAKLDANKRRDRGQTRRLRRAGWKVLRVWAHEQPERAATRIARLNSLARTS